MRSNCSRTEEASGAFHNAPGIAAREAPIITSETAALSPRLSSERSQGARLEAPRAERPAEPRPKRLVLGVTDKDPEHFTPAVHGSVVDLDFHTTRRDINQERRGVLRLFR